MGMYDNIDFECVCPVCHSKVTGFQSKGGDRLLNTLQPTDVSNFYSDCDKCGCWIEYNAKTATNYIRTVEGKIKGKRGTLSGHTKEVNL